MSMDGKEDAKMDEAAMMDKADMEGEKKSLIAAPKMPTYDFNAPPPPESAGTDPDKFNLKPCCCCLCACSHDRVGDATCFGCCPIKCGAIFVALFIFLLSIIMLACTFFQFLNEYIPWWFVFIELLL